MNFRIISILITSVLMFAGCSVTDDDKQLPYQFRDPTVLNNLDSVEYKILLDPATLKNTSGFNAIWDTLKKTATQQSVTVDTEKKPFNLSYRTIQYLDTVDLELRENGYTLRYRQKYKKYSEHGNDNNRLGKKYDVTLKYRNKDKATSRATPVSANTQRYDNKTKVPKLEADVTTGGIIFSHSITLTLKEGIHGSFADLFDDSVTGQKGYSTMFPELADLNMTGNVLTPVADLTIVEAKAELGKLVFVNNIRSSVAISRFSNSEGASIAAEVSFDFDIAGKTHTVTFEELKQIEIYYTTLVTNLGEVVLEGTTKTAYIYSIAD